LDSNPVSNIYLFAYDEPEDIEMEYLQLKNLSSISNEDAKQIAIQNRYTHGKNDEAFIKVGKDILDRIFNTEKYYTEYPICLTAESCDFLRSKGYAMPWMGVSVEKLVEYGWIKLV